MKSAEISGGQPLDGWKKAAIAMAVVGGVLGGVALVTAAVALTVLFAPAIIPAAAIGFAATVVIASMGTVGLFIPTMIAGALAVSAIGLAALFGIVYAYKMKENKEIVPKEGQEIIARNALLKLLENLNNRFDGFPIREHINNHINTIMNSKDSEDVISALRLLRAESRIWEEDQCYSTFENLIKQADELRAIRNLK